MPDLKLDPIILGHNPFFGIDHLSQTAGNEKAQRFEDVGRVMDVLRYCHDLGVRGLMMSTHPRANAVCGAMEHDPSTFGDWRVYPLVPYVNKYVRAANERGLLNVVQDTFSRASMRQKFALLMQGGRVLTGDLRRVFTVLLDVELLPFSHVQMGAVFLHDVFTDLALGLGLESLLELFRDHVAETHGVPAGFATKNLPLLCERLARRGSEPHLVMASVNAAGFYMNPSRERVVEAMRATDVAVVAMNTLASGHLAPDTAYQYLREVPRIRSVVVGVSRTDHAGETIQAIRRHVGFLNGQGAA